MPEDLQNGLGDALLLAKQANDRHVIKVLPEEALAVARLVFNDGWYSIVKPEVQR